MIAWRAQYTRGDHGYPTIVLETVASVDLWIWHAFFGVVGSRNDINVLNESPIFNEVLKGNAPEVNFIVNGTQYTKGLTDGIYPECATFVKSFSCPKDLKRMKFKERQEAAKKDVERAFGVFQARWAIIRGPGRHWFMDKCKEIMYTCIILHNMIVEDEGHAISIWDREEQDTITANHGSTSEFAEDIRRNSDLRDTQRAIFVGHCHNHNHDSTITTFFSGHHDITFIAIPIDSFVIAALPATSDIDSVLSSRFERNHHRRNTNTDD
ncbi:uncharacterized protein LOC121999692 [Zingiber officinale]|uniref:uncharacterized protein LOC121999692 n=1 Tax=Zingiber officinale TaxID=94328 RepID=UPI001C4CEBD3|nr:uncharacterized protein LOC121999692 [Zingiber officinale]